MLRFNKEDGCKETRPLVFCEGPDGQRQWRWQMFAAPRPLYGLERLRARIEAPVLLVEGEKAADAAQELFPELVVVTSPGGSNAASKADWSPLQGRLVTIWPDADGAGAKYALQVATLLQEAGAGSLRLVELPKGLPQGWDLADDPPSAWSPERRQEMLAGAAPFEPEAPEDSKEETPPPRPWPFKVSSEGVFKRVDKKDKDSGEITTRWMRVCSELRVLAETRDFDLRNWGRHLAIKTREGAVNTWTMPMQLLNGNGNEYRGILLSLGLEIESNAFARQALTEYINNARPNERWRCVDRIGWHGQVFVLPDDEIFGNTAGERILLQSNNGASHAFKICGDLQGWQENIARYCAGNSRLAFALSAAFAAPLLHLAGLEGGGFHFRGESSRGKTTALHVAGSVWGGGDMGGYIKTWRGTGNGMEALGLGHCDALLCLDEMSLIDAREAGEAAEMLANGTGKARARQDGLGAPQARWRTLFLSTGEVALADKMAEAGRRARAGQEVRLADIPADAGRGLGLFENLHDFTDPAALADHLRQTAGQHYGHAIRSFLDAICQADAQELSDTIRNYRESFTAQACPHTADGQVKRAARRFGLVAAAGEIAITLEILPWPEGEALEAAHACFRAWLENRGGSGAHEVGVIISQVKYFMEQHGESRFTPWDAEKGARTINRAGFKKAVDADVIGTDGHSGWEYYVLPETFSKELCASFDKRLVIRVLREHGYLEPGSDGKSMSTHKPPALGKPIKLYKFSPSILAD
ncbi:MAG: DUF927 domain-containing protein [Proteobacteria bacterium]|nr:DUF927 domain-containing protein [Pseudomonadota bacterium]